MVLNFMISNKTMNYLKIQISYTECQDSGDIIIDTESMLEDYNNQIFNLINKH